MKKIISIGFFSAIFLFAAFSCSEEVSSVKREKPDELLGTLAEFNENLISARPSSRGILRVLSVASADVAGAYELGRIGGKVGLFFGGFKGALIGGGVCGLVGGVAASYSAYCTTRSAQINDSKLMVTAAYAALKVEKEVMLEYPRDNIAVAIPVGYEDVIDVGIKHNIMLDMIRTEPDLLSDVDVNGILSPQEKEILESEEFIENYNRLMPKYASMDVNDYLSAASVDSVDSRVMGLFLDLYNQYPEDIADVRFIVEKYIEMIEASDVFTDDEKRCIYTGLAVAVCSFEYWEGEQLVK